MTDKDPLLLAGISTKKVVEKETPHEQDSFFNRAQERNKEEKANDEEIAKSKLSTKIRNYYQAFPFLQECMPKKKQEKMSLVELEQEFERLRQTLNSKAALENVRKIDQILNKVTEYVLCSQGVPATGLYELSCSKEGLEMMHQEHQEFALDYSEWLGSSKEIRYLMKSMSKIMIIIDYNKKKMESTVSEEDEKKYADL